MTEYQKPRVIKAELKITSIIVDQYSFKDAHPVLEDKICSICNKEFNLAASTTDLDIHISKHTDEEILKMVIEDSDFVFKGALLNGEQK